MAWDTGIPTYSSNDLIDEDDLNDILNNLNYLHTPDVKYHAEGDGSGNYTNTSLSYVAIGSPFSYTATMKTGYVLVIFRGNIYATSGTGENIFYGVALDGTVIRHRVGHDLSRAGYIAVPIAVTAGSRTIAMYWKNSAAGSTFSLINSGGEVPLFYVREISWTP